MVHNISTTVNRMKTKDDLTCKFKIVHPYFHEYLFVKKELKSNESSIYHMIFIQVMNCASYFSLSLLIPLYCPRFSLFPSLTLTYIHSHYLFLSYNLRGLANQNQALRQNTSRYFIPKMSVFNTSKVLCNSHVMFVYVIIVHYC